MTATLFELGQRFPTDVATVAGSPARILEADFRLSLRRRLGASEAALDVARPRVPDRLGVGLRPYEPGDALRALSRSHLLRTGELFTRTEQAPGRQRCRILYLHSAGMMFRSPEAAANKGQVALAAAAIVEAAHAGWGHAVRFFSISDASLVPQALSHHAEYVYVITDLLFEKSDRDAAGERLLKWLADVGVPRAAVFVVRDPWEQPVGNSLGTRGARLVDFSDGSSDLSRFSGEDYLRNLRQQLEVFQARGRSVGVQSHLLTGRISLETLVDSLCEFAGARRHA